jgi:hypothetical protein
MKKPCKVCPYKRDSLNGWLGDVSGNPQQFLTQLETPMLHPCHATVHDWDNDEELESRPKCIGALQFMNNSLKLSRYPQIAKAQKEVGKNEEVFTWGHEFISYHNTSMKIKE